MKKFHLKYISFEVKRPRQTGKQHQGINDVIIPRPFRDKKTQHSSGKDSAQTKKRKWWTAEIGIRANTEPSTFRWVDGKYPPEDIFSCPQLSPQDWFFQVINFFIHHINPPWWLNSIFNNCVLYTLTLMKTILSFINWLKAILSVLVIIPY